MWLTGPHRGFFEREKSGKKIYLHEKYSYSPFFVFENQDSVGINGNSVKMNKWKRYDLCKWPFEKINYILYNIIGKT
jgi:hypothetical protein